MNTPAISALVGAPRCAAGPPTGARALRGLRDARAEVLTFTAPTSKGRRHLAGKLHPENVNNKIKTPKEFRARLNLNSQTTTRPCTEIMNDRLNHGTRNNPLRRPRPVRPDQERSAYPARQTSLRAREHLGRPAPGRSVSPLVNTDVGSSVRLAEVERRRIGRNAFRLSNAEKRRLRLRPLASTPRKNSPPSKAKRDRARPRRPHARPPSPQARTRSATRAYRSARDAQPDCHAWRLS